MDRRHPEENRRRDLYEPLHTAQDRQPLERHQRKTIPRAACGQTRRACRPESLRGLGWSQGAVLVRAPGNGALTRPACAVQVRFPRVDLLFRTTAWLSACRVVLGHEREDGRHPAATAGATDGPVARLATGSMNP